MMIKTLLASTALALSMGMAEAATTVSFSSFGVFSNITNCAGGGFTPCSISTGSNGPGTVLNMSGNNASTLTAVDRSASVLTPQNDLILGEIAWQNNASGDGFLTPTDQDFNVQYTFTLAFTAPTGQSDNQTFNLNILQPTNPVGDSVLNVTNATLSGLGPFTLAGIAMTDLHFITSGNGSTYNGSTWSNPEGGLAHLYIVADFNDAVVNPNAVPEPLSIAVLGAGLLGLGVAKRRRV